MIIYWSMLLWSPIIFFVYSLNHKEDILLTEYNLQQGVNKRIPIMYAIITFGYFVFWIGERKYVADTSLYISDFQRLSSDFSTAWSSINWDSKGPGFEIFNVIYKCFISDNYTWWLMTIAIICGACVMITLWRYSCDFFFSAFLFISMGTFSWLMNGMRQFICVAILFALCDLIKNKKIIIYILIVILLYYVHNSVILMIPIYFIAKSKPWSKMTTVFIFGIVLITVFSEPFFKGVDSALTGSSYSGATDDFSIENGVNPIRVLFYALIPIGAFIKRENLAKYYNKYPMLSIMINMSLITVSLYFVGMFTNGIMIGRLPIYCEVYNLILIPFILKFGFSKDEQSIIKPIVIIVYVLFFYMQFNQMSYHSELTGLII